MIRTAAATKANNHGGVGELLMSSSSSSSFDEEESSFTGNGNEDKDRAASVIDEESLLAKQETSVVLRLKVIVGLVLIVSAVVVATSVSYYLSRNEEKQFETQYREDSLKILAAVGSSLDKTFGLLDSAATTIVSAARMSKQKWPFITIPDFAVRMAKLLPLTDSINVVFLPLVTPRNRLAWENYTRFNNGWVNEGVKLQAAWKTGYFGPTGLDSNRSGVINGDFGELPYNITNRNFTPSWQTYPVIANLSWTYNYDWLSVSFSEFYMRSLDKRLISITKPYMLPTPGDPIEEAETKVWAENFRAFLRPDEEPLEPLSDLSYPIIDDLSSIELSSAGAENKSSAPNVVGIMGATIYYRSLIRHILPEGSNGIQIVFSNPCAKSFTYQINGPVVKYLGVGDHHDKNYDKYVHKELLYDLADRKGSAYSGAPPDREICPMTLSIYPSDEMKFTFVSSNPIIFTVAVIMIFLFTSLVFVLYDVMVEKRQRKVMSTAVKSSAIVSSLFPVDVRDRLYPTNTDGPSKYSSDELTPAGDGTTFSDTPIANLYPETTVMFADIAGFTAWSSTRQPSQVFVLLETLYAGFDEIAKHRGVFKVETIGDSYVAVAGLPTPRKHHAVVMARFASDCLMKMREVVTALETTLGPGTADLALRCGLNSGPTTAGVLRGEKSRFQLFGDTVNTAARMEGSGQPNKIHVSSKTAELIEVAGKGHWLALRHDQVNCKGKGLMTTYWCQLKSESMDIGAGSSHDMPLADVTSKEPAKVETTKARLVDWQVDMFTKLLHGVVLNQDKNGAKDRNDCSDAFLLGKTYVGNPIDEISESMNLQEPREKICDSAGDRSRVCPEVLNQLRELITDIADLYPDSNPFHNFEHCSHVAMSTMKLLDRIASGQCRNKEATQGNETNIVRVLSDPLTRFGIVFAALVHDVDHPGVSNMQLVQEGHSCALFYKGRSVAEQNSIDKTWALLMEPRFWDLRCALFANESDLKHFRQIVLNAVIATDLFDQDLKSMRQRRWEKSFAPNPEQHTDHGCNLRVAIVIDLIIQASDVSHTMQHFTVYKKWNTCLLTEMYDAYRKQSGNSIKDPLDGWYEGELCFFDKYIIPLAQKLRECGVFGVSCDEFLDYAKDNRIEWERKGRGIVEEARAALLARPTLTEI